MPKKPSTENAARRNFVKKAAYIAPAILTLKAAPSFAKPGSEKTYPPRRTTDPVIPPSV